MGAWGVTARQSDYGSDMLALIEADYLKPIGFKHFDVKGIMEFCKNHIIEGIRREEGPYVSDSKEMRQYEVTSALQDRGFTEKLEILKKTTSRDYRKQREAT